MSNKIKLYEYDLLDFLDTEEKMIDYLNSEIEEGDIVHIKKALETIARKRDINEFLKKTKLSPHIINTILENNSSLEYKTLQNFLRIINMHLIAVPNDINYNTP